MTSVVAPLLALNMLATYQDPISEEMTRFTDRGGVDVSLLDGGFEAGRLHLITSQTSLPSSHILHRILAAHLASSHRATGTIIDSTLAFDVAGLYRVIEQAQKSHVQAGSEPEKREAILVLEQLNIMEVFDYVGLQEAVDEVSDTLKTIPVNEVLEVTDKDSGDQEDVLSNSRCTGNPSISTVPRNKSMHLLVIQDISRIFMPLLKNNYTQGQAMVTRFMRSLKRLTRAHNVCTVIIASAAARTIDEQEQISQFHSCPVRPALGMGVGYLFDVHMYHYEMSKKSELAPCSSRSVDPHTQAGIAQILEVVEDRFVGRVGRWMAITSDANGIMRDIS